MATIPGVGNAASTYPYSVLKAFENAGAQTANIANSAVDDSTLASIKADIDTQFDAIRDALVAAGIVAEA